jgi:hypothetical protein
MTADRFRLSGEQRTTFIVIGLSALVPCALLFDPRRQFGPDWPSHAFSISYFGEYVRHHGMLPSTMSTSALLGAPNPVFYGVMFYPIVGLAAAAIGTDLAIRVALIGAVVLQSWQVYLSARAMSGDRWLAYTLVVAVNASIYALTNLYDRGDLTEFAGIALLYAAVASWLRAPYVMRPTRVYLQSGLYLALAMAANPIVALLGGPAYALAALVAWPRDWQRTLRGAAIVFAIDLVVLAPWLYAYAKYHPFRELGPTLFSKAPRYYPGIDTPWSLFHFTPYDGHMSGTVNLDAQLNLVLGVVVAGLAVQVYRRGRSLFPGLLALAIAVAIGLYSALPAAGSWAHALGTIQTAYRLVAYADIVLFVAALLMAAQLRGSGDVRSVRMFAVVATLAAVVVGLKLTRANDDPLVPESGIFTTHPEVLAGPWQTATVYVTPVHAPDQVDKPMATTLSAGTGANFGVPETEDVSAPRGMNVVVTNVQSFPWNHLTLDGRVLPATEEIVALQPVVPGGTNVNPLAVGFRSLGGRHALGLTSEPDAVWLILRFISFWTVIALAATLVLVRRNQRSAG